ncbi:hypothetical protein Tco_0573622 [Tanacetum coccineum]
MDDPNITMEEYITLEEEKARRRGKVFNLETAKYGKIWYDEDVHDLRSVETEFPGIVFNNNVTSNETLSYEPMVSSLNDEIDFRISFDEFDDEDYTVVFDKNSFSYKIFSTNDLKTDSENDNEKVNKPLFLPPEPTVSCFDELDFFKDFENKFPAIVYNDALTSKSDFLTEPTDNDDDKIDIEHSSGDLSLKPLPNVINVDDGAYAHGSNKLLETRTCGVFIIWNSRSVGVLTNLKEAVQHILARKLNLENHLEQHIREVPQNAQNAWAWSEQRELLFKKSITVDESTQAILDLKTDGGIFLYKSPNQAFQILEDKVLFEHDWSTKSQNDHHQKSVSFTDESGSNNDSSRFIEKLMAMNSQIISLNEELQDLRNKYNELREGNASKNDDTPMCERHGANYIQSEGYQNQNSQDLFSHQSLHDPNDSEKSLTELNNDVRNDLEYFKRHIRSMRNVHWKLYDNDDHKTTGVLPNKESKTINQEPQAKTDFKKSITKFLDGQRVTNIFFKNNINDMILKMKQNEKNFQTIFKNLERKIDEWEKSQNLSLEQTNRTDPPPPPQAQTEQVNVVFTRSGKSDDSPKTQPIIVNNKIGKDRPIKTSKKDYQVVKTNEYPFRDYIPKIPYPQRLNVDHSHLNRIVKVS